METLVLNKRKLQDLSQVFEKEGIEQVHVRLKAFF